jgi:Cys-rich repeat protein
VAVGRASVPLTAMGASGALYRLTAATFTIAGPTSTMLSTDALPDSETIDVALNAGAYQVTLQAGWGLTRTLGGVTQAVEAVLVSANPLSFAISDQVITPVSFVFQVDGDVIPMGQGVLRLGIAVEETGGACMSDAECAPDESCDLATGECVPAECSTDADCGAGQWCFTSLSFGNFCVAAGPGGIGAACDAGNIFSCAPHLACIELGVGPTCHAFCAVAAPMCGAGEMCAAFQTTDGNPSDVGACIMP